jgi:integrase/recombinase XerC
MFEEKLQDFVQFLKFEKRYSVHTVTAYEQDLIQFRNYLAEIFQIDDICVVNHFHIRSWLAGIKDDKNKARTINRKMSSLNSFYKFLQRAGAVERNPVRMLHAQRLPERLPVSLKEAETEHLLDTVAFDTGFKGNTDRLICELFYVTGMRRQELLQLKEQDVEWGLKQVRILGKGNKERLVPVGTALLDNLRDYLAEKRTLPGHDEVYFFNLENGKPLYPNYVYRTVTTYLSQTTTMQKKSPHVMRHTFATHLLNNGANIQAIKELLGHSSLAATQVYTHNNIGKLKEIHKQNHPRG